jgi:signal peptidase I
MGFFTLFAITLLPVHYGLYLMLNKTGDGGWKAFIPMYNYIVLSKRVGRPWYWAIGLLAPGLNLIVFFAYVVAFFRSFGIFDSERLWKYSILYPYYVPQVAKTRPYYGTGNHPIREPNTVRDWVESILFAVVVATIIKTYLAEPFRIPSASMEDEMLTGDFLVVSKMSYGAQVPLTPLTFPFVHNSLPFTETTPSFLEWWKGPDWRLPGWTSPKSGDIIVFNFPVNDTMVVDPVLKAFSYYDQLYMIVNQELSRKGIDPATMSDSDFELVLGQARQAFLAQYQVRAMPIDKRENFVKRCTGGPGDLFEIRSGQIYINGKPQKNPDMLAHHHKVYTKQVLTEMVKTELRSFYFSNDDALGFQTYNDPIAGSFYLLNLNSKQVNYLKGLPGIDSVVQLKYPLENNLQIWPNHPSFNHSVDQMGPFLIPAKGTNIALNRENLILYGRIIRAYEKVDLEIRKGEAFIDGQKVNEYTFRQNYYWAMGDNRHGSLDSRFWGPVPEDHIKGTPWIVVFSLDGERPGNMLKQLRTDRFFYLPN